MSVKIVGPTESIDVKQLCIVEYGQPGSRKTSLAQTAEEPFTVATDPGIYRCFGRKGCGLVDTWADILEVAKTDEFEKAKTIIYDTLGMTLDKLGATIISDSPKNGNRMGGLSLQGYGVLANQFSQFVSNLKLRGKDVVFVAHEKIEGGGDDTYARPDIVGKSYGTVMNVSDMVGYMHFMNGKKIIDFAPSDRWMAKCPPWNRESHIELPDFGAQPDFLAKLISEAKASMGRISQDSAKIAAQVDEWRAKLKPEMKLTELNAMLPDLSKLPQIAKAQAWAATLAFAEPLGLVFDAKTKAFKVKEAA